MSDCQIEEKIELKKKSELKSQELKIVKNCEQESVQIDTNPKMLNEKNKLPRALRCLVDYNYTGKDKQKAIESAVANNSITGYVPPVRRASIRNKPVELKFKPA